METYFNNDNYASSGSRLKDSLGAVRNNSESLLLNFSNLADSHLELLSEETTVQKTELMNGLITLICAVILVITSIICGSLALAAFLDETFAAISMSGGLAIVGGGWLLVSVIVLYQSYQHLAGVSILPSATIKSLRETIKCLKN